MKKLRSLLPVVLAVLVFNLIAVGCKAVPLPIPTLAVPSLKPKEEVQMLNGNFDQGLADWTVIESREFLGSPRPGVSVVEWQGKKALQLYRDSSDDIGSIGVVQLPGELGGAAGVKRVKAEVWIENQEFKGDLTQKPIFPFELAVRDKSLDSYRLYAYVEALKVPPSPYIGLEGESIEIVKLQSGKWNSVQLTIPEDMAVLRVSLLAKGQGGFETYIANVRFER